ncbi:LysR substrate-binding domain-containing protein [Brucella pseudogrignonensis]|uniref:LysR substrate-binding domain-containing protein n=1 Tax=Brucella pseudogrignonensis TaxID=419475 RepID=UPI003D9976AE
MFDHLPPLQNLRAFEAAGRHLSMTLAAKELNLTHGAISRKIKSLEYHLGVPLFHRFTRKIDLTESGSAHHGAVTRILAELSRETELIQRPGKCSRLVLSTGISFASKWLTSRLHRLVEHHPHFDVQLEVTDVNVNFAEGKVDAAVHYGSGNYAFAESERIMTETVVPVCSPKYQNQMHITNPVDLRRCKLLHENRMNATWEAWFASRGLSYEGVRGTAFSHGSMSIDAAIRGEGIALGRTVLVADDISSGRLVTPFPHDRIEADLGYDLVFRTGHQNHVKVKAVRDSAFLLG